MFCLPVVSCDACCCICCMKVFVVSDVNSSNTASNFFQSALSVLHFLMCDVVHGAKGDGDADEEEGERASNTKEIGKWSECSARSCRTEKSEKR